MRSTCARSIRRARSRRPSPGRFPTTAGSGCRSGGGDGKELYYLGSNGAIMAADVTTTPAFKAGPPRVLFRLSEETPVAAGTSNVSRDGERILIAVPPPQLVQMTVSTVKARSSDASASRAATACRASPRTERAWPCCETIPTPAIAICGRSMWPPARGRRSRTTLRRTTCTCGRRTASSSPTFRMRGSDASLYRKASDGTGPEELLFRYTDGTFMGLTDWSRDGKYLTFFTGVLAVLPVGSQRSRPSGKRSSGCARNTMWSSGGFRPTRASSRTFQ